MEGFVPIYIYYLIQPTGSSSVQLVKMILRRNEALKSRRMILPDPPVCWDFYLRQACRKTAVA